MTNFTRFDNATRDDSPPTDTGGAAKFLGVSVRTMEEWRKKGTGPRYRQVGRMIRYNLTDLRAFLDPAYLEAAHQSDAER